MNASADRPVSLTRSYVRLRLLVEDAEREAHLGLDVLGALGLDELAVQTGRARVGAGVLIPIVLLDLLEEVGDDRVRVGLVQVSV